MKYTEPTRAAKLMEYYERGLIPIMIRAAVIMTLGLGIARMLDGTI